MSESKNYDPLLSQAGFMDLVCALIERLEQPESKVLLNSMHQAERQAALQLGTAAKNYIDVIEGR